MVDKFAEFVAHLLFFIVLPASPVVFVWHSFSAEAGMWALIVVLSVVLAIAILNVWYRGQEIKDLKTVLQMEEQFTN